MGHQQDIYQLEPEEGVEKQTILYDVHNLVNRRPKRLNFTSNPFGLSSGHELNCALDDGPPSGDTLSRPSCTG